MGPEPCDLGEIKPAVNGGGGGGGSWSVVRSNLPRHAQQSEKSGREMKRVERASCRLRVEGGRGAFPRYNWLSESWSSIFRKPKHEEYNNNKQVNSNQACSERLTVGGHQHETQTGWLDRSADRDGLFQRAMTSRASDETRRTSPCPPTRSPHLARDPVVVAAVFPAVRGHRVRAKAVLQHSWLAVRQGVDARLGVNLATDNSNKERVENTKRKKNSR